MTASDKDPEQALGTKDIKTNKKVRERERERTSGDTEYKVKDAKLNEFRSLSTPQGEALISWIYLKS